MQKLYDTDARLLGYVSAARAGRQVLYDCDRRIRGYYYPATDKTYDGSTEVALTGGTLNGVIEGDIAGQIDADAIHAMGTAGTGGFGVRNTSIAEYSAYEQWVITIFMIAFGVNFNVYYLILLRKFKKALRCEEMRWYLVIILVATVLICANIYDVALSVEQNVRIAVFQVASVITTTGFSTVNFDLWPELSRGILVVLMFIGACAGSTGGGLKVSRIAMAGKSVCACLGSFLHPRSIRRIRFEGKDVDDGTLRVIFAYFCGMTGIFVVSVLIVSLENLDLVSTFTAIATTINNVGPALGVAGPSSNFSGFSDLSKCVMAFDMLAGRLEVFPMLMLFYPPLWRETLTEARRRKHMGAEGRPYPVRRGE